MPADGVAGGALVQVHGSPAREFAEVRLRERLGPGLERKRVVVARDDRQARAVHRDALADFELRREHRFRYAERPPVVPITFSRPDRAKRLNQSCEHAASGV